MNKKLMTLAVAGAFAAPAAAFAQASKVQIFGTIYMEYAYTRSKAAGRRLQLSSTNPPEQHCGYGGDQVNVDILQTPGSSEIGIKGEEALGGGYVGVVPVRKHRWTSAARAANLSRYRQARRTAVSCAAVTARWVSRAASVIFMPVTGIRRGRSTAPPSSARTKRARSVCRACCTAIRPARTMPLPRPCLNAVRTIRSITYRQPGVVSPRHCKSARRKPRPVRLPSNATVGKAADGGCWCRYTNGPADCFRQL